MGNTTEWHDQYYFILGSWDDYCMGRAEVFRVSNPKEVPFMAHLQKGQIVHVKWLGALKIGERKVSAFNETRRRLISYFVHEVAV